MQRYRATIVPWKQGKILVWDAPCPDTLAPSHSSLAIREAGAVAADAEFKKTAKICSFGQLTSFCSSCSRDTWGVWGRGLFKDIGRRISLVTQEPLSHQYLVQRIAVAVQRGNAAAVLGTVSGVSDVFHAFVPL